MEFIIRKYKKQDKKDLRRICCDTAFMGKPMEYFFQDREILADFVTSYYTDYEPDSIFIAEVSGKVIGYLTGCKNVKRIRKIFIIRIFPKILLKFFSKRIILLFRNKSLFINYFRSFLKSEFKYPLFLKKYPATLHINIDYKFRNKKIGKKLIKNYFNYLKFKNIKGIHVFTISFQAERFFKKMGFIILYQDKVSYFKYLGWDNIFKTILVKKL